MITLNGHELTDEQRRIVDAVVDGKYHPRAYDSELDQLVNKGILTIHDEWDWFGHGRRVRCEMPPEVLGRYVTERNSEQLHQSAEEEA